MLNLFELRKRNIKNDILSGITVALALVPEAVAFAFLAGVSPVMGLYSAFFIGLITAVCGGRPGMISGATGAMAVIVVTLVAQHGVEYLFPTVMLCGLIQILVGLGRLGMLIRMVPHSVLLGFVNGLAIVIFMAQFGSFQTVNAVGRLAYIQGPPLWIMFALTALTMAIIWLLPKFTRALPASLVAILVVTGLATVLNSTLDQRFAAENQQRVALTVGDMLLTNAKANAVAATDIASSKLPEAAAQAAVQRAMQQVSPESVSLSARAAPPILSRIRHVSPHARDALDHSALRSRTGRGWPDRIAHDTHACRRDH